MSVQQIGSKYIAWIPNVKIASHLSDAEDELMSCGDFFKWREVKVEPQVISEGYTG